MAFPGPNNINGDLNVSGNITAGSMVIPPLTITNAMVSASAAIDASKLVTRVYAKRHQVSTAVTETVTLHTAYAAGTIQALAACVITAPVGAATVTIDIKKNGTTILTGVLTLNSSSVAYTPQSGTLATTTYVASDTFTAVITATAGGGTLPTGLLVELILNENPS